MCGMEIILCGTNLIQRAEKAIGFVLIAAGCLAVVVGIAMLFPPRNVRKTVRSSEETQMAFVELAKKSDVPPGTMKAFELSGKKILLANDNGNFLAITNKCPHIGKPLNKGTLDGSIVTCPYHKAKFDLRNGQNMQDAKLLFLKMTCKSAQTFLLRIDDDKVLIKLD